MFEHIIFKYINDYIIINIGNIDIINNREKYIVLLNNILYNLFSENYYNIFNICNLCKKLYIKNNVIFYKYKDISILSHNNINKKIVSSFLNYKKDDNYIMKIIFFQNNYHKFNNLLDNNINDNNIKWLKKSLINNKNENIITTCWLHPTLILDETYNYFETHGKNELYALVLFFNNWLCVINIHNNNFGGKNNNIKSILNLIMKNLQSEIYLEKLKKYQIIIGGNFGISSPKNNEVLKIINKNYNYTKNFIIVSTTNNENKNNILVSNNDFINTEKINENNINDINSEPSSFFNLKINRNDNLINNI